MHFYGMQKILSPSIMFAVCSFSLLLLLAPTPSEAQIHLGVQGSYGEESDFGIGARMTADLEQLIKVKGVELILSFDYFFPEDDWDIPFIEVDYTYYEVNANLVYNARLQNAAFIPYFGGGLNIAKGEVSADILGFSINAIDETETGFNVLAGLKVPTNRLTPFLEFRFESGGGEQYVVSAGIVF